jgi:aminopeptidase N
MLAQDGRALTLETSSDAEEGRARPEELARSTFVLDRETRRIVFRNIEEKPVLSLFRSFSAPVRIKTETTDADYTTLARFDSDLFNRWQAIQTCATQYLLAAVQAIRSGQAQPEAAGLISILTSSLMQAETDPEFTAQALSLPGDSDIAREIGQDVDPDSVFSAGRALRRSCGVALGDKLTQLYDRLSIPQPWSPDAASAGRRALRGAVLSYLIAGDRNIGASLAIRQFRAANNMTDRMAALGALCMSQVPEREAALDEFYEAFKDDHLVMDKWFALQAMIPEAGTLARVKRLMGHPLFSMTNPNRFRSLISTFAAANPTQFNAADGSGYEFVADLIPDLDARNPQVASRLLVAFRSWKTLEVGRKSLAEAALRRIAERDNLSPDVRDIVTRSLA